MRLHVQRTQELKSDRKGRPQAAVLALSIQLELTYHEAEIADRYLLWSMPLTLDGHGNPKDTIKSLVDGRVTRVVRSQIEMAMIGPTNVVELEADEQMIIDVCRKLPALFAATVVYGGSDVVDLESSDLLGSGQG